MYSGKKHLGTLNMKSERSKCINLENNLSQKKSFYLNCEQEEFIYQGHGHFTEGETGKQILMIMWWNYSICRFGQNLAPAIGYALLFLWNIFFHFAPLDLDQQEQGTILKYLWGSEGNNRASFSDYAYMTHVMRKQTRSRFKISSIFGSLIFYKIGSICTIVVNLVSK